MLRTPSIRIETLERVLDANSATAKNNVVNTNPSDRYAPRPQRSWWSALFFVAALFGYPAVAVVSEFGGLDNRSVSIGYRTAFLVFAVILIFYRQKEAWRWYRGELWMLLIIFWSIYILRVVQYGWESGGSDNELMFAVGSALLPSLAFLSAQTTEELRRIYRWLLDTGLLLSLAAAYLVWTSFEFRSGEMSRGGL